jgi:hypothetical protein
MVKDPYPVPGWLFVGCVLLLVPGATGCTDSSWTTKPAQPGFTLTANPASLEIPAGGSGYAVVSVNRVNGFTGAVNLSMAGLPAGVVTSGTIADTATTGYLTIAVDPSVTPQSWSSLTLGGQAGTLTSSAPFTLTVEPALPASGFSPNLTNATGGQQSGGTLTNTFLFMQPAAQTPQASASGTFLNQEGFLLDPLPYAP